MAITRELADHMEMSLPDGRMRLSEMGERGRGYMIAINIVAKRDHQNSRESKMSMIRSMVQRDVESTKDLTLGEAKAVLKCLT